jgi:hypothetical protein
MALGSTQPIIEMSTRKLPEGKCRPARKADNFTAVCEPIVYQMWDLDVSQPCGASTAFYKDSFTFYWAYWIIEE